MRFLIDEQLPPALCGWLRERGHEAEHVTDALGTGAGDGAVAGHAVSYGAILITKDRDFCSRSECAVVWLRLGNATIATLLPWLEARWDTTEALLSGGERLVELR